MYRLKPFISNPTSRCRSTARFVALEQLEPWTGQLLPGVTPQEEKHDDAIAFEKNDVLFGKLRPYLAKHYLADDAGCCSSELLVLRPGGEILPTFLHLVVGSHDFVEWANANSFGVKMPRTSWMYLADYRLRIPSTDEQRRLVSEIRGEIEPLLQAIGLKSRMIELLRARRRAVVTQVIGEVVPPAQLLERWSANVRPRQGWRVVSLRRVLSHIEQGWSPQCESRVAEPGEWGVLKAGAVNGGVFQPTQNKALPPHLKSRPWLAVEPGDLLMSRANGSPRYVGSVGIVTPMDARLMLCDKLLRLVPAEGVDPRYLMYALSSQSTRMQIRRDAAGSSSLKEHQPGNRTVPSYPAATIARPANSGISTGYGD